MDGTNAAGRKVSLLNDNGPSSHHFTRSASITPSLPSRTSSYLGSPCGSPTPQLVRSHSSDSNAMQTPSPITPDYAYNPYDCQMDSHDLNKRDLDNGSEDFESPYFEDKHHSGAYQPVPQHRHQNGAYQPMPGQKYTNGAYQPAQQPSVPLPYHPSHSTQVAYFAEHQMSEEQVAPSSAVSANGRPKKNQYPCPMAKKYNCQDYFTTSGHAARHAKKHTGKKDAFCPECNKAFTRKDNMEQHRRTHQNGRSSTKGVDRDVRKAKSQARATRPKSTPIQPLQSDMHSPMSPLPISPSFMIPAVQHSDSFNDFSIQGHYPDPTSFTMVQPYPHDPAPANGALMELASTAIQAEDAKKRANERRESDS